MKVADLIAALQQLPPDLPVMVINYDAMGAADRWAETVEHATPTTIEALDALRWPDADSGPCVLLSAAPWKQS